METIIEKVDINLLHENDINPRLIDESKLEKLKASIEEFPEMLEKRPLIVNSNYEVLGGNMRLKASKELELKELPVIKVNWPEEKQKEFIIKDNVAFGEWDVDLLHDEFDLSDLEEWGLDIFDDINDESGDIEEIDTFSESVNFSIKCANLEEMKKLQSKLGTDSSKMDYEKFIQLTGL